MRKWPLLILAVTLGVIPSAPLAGASGSAIVQAAPLSGTSAAQSRFSDQLHTTDTSGVVRFAVTSTLPTGVTVSSLGVIQSTGFIAVGNYTIMGTDSDTNGNVGSWTYTLTIGADNAQLIEQYGLIDISVFGIAHQFIIVLNGSFAPLTYVATSALPSGVTVSSNGVIQVDGSTPSGTYSISGSASDIYGSEGQWSVVLLVVPRSPVLFTNPISQKVGVGNAVATAFSPPASSVGAVTFTTIRGSGVTVSPTGGVSAPSTLAPGIYAAVGSMTDSVGTVGVWQVVITVVGLQNYLVKNAPIPGLIAVGKPVSPDLRLTSGGLGVMTVQTPDVCAVTGGELRAVAAGTCTVSITNPGNNEYPAVDFTGVIVLCVDRAMSTPLTGFNPKHADLVTPSEKSTLRDVAVALAQHNYVGPSIKFRPVILPGLSRIESQSAEVAHAMALRDYLLAQVSQLGGKLPFASFMMVKNLRDAFEVTAI